MTDDINLTEYEILKWTIAFEQARHDDTPTKDDDND